MKRFFIFYNIKDNDHNKGNCKNIHDFTSLKNSFKMLTTRGKASK